MSGDQVAADVEGYQRQDTIMTNGTATENESKERHIHFIVAVMQAEKYYTSIDETKASIIPEMSSMLIKADLIQFYQACGPNYIRSIRRASELTSMFIYISQSTAADSTFSRDVNRVSKLNQGYTRSKKKEIRSNSNVNSMIIKVFGYGLGVEISSAEEDGKMSLVPAGMDDFARVMNTGFAAMVNPLCGMVRNVEIVPWASNAAFQNTIQLDLPISRSTYQCLRNSAGQTVDVNGTTTICFDGTGDTDASTCGYTDGGDTENFDPRKCRVTGSEDALHKDLRKFNLIANAEFIVRMNQIIRNKIYRNELHMKCINQLFKVPPNKMTNRLMNHRLGFYFNNLQIIMTPKMLLFKLLYGDSVNGTESDYTLAANPETIISNDPIRYLFARKLEEISMLISNYFTPCVLKLSEMRNNIESANLQMTHWTRVPQCNKISCTLPNTFYVPDPDLDATAVINITQSVNPTTPGTCRSYNNTDPLEKDMVNLNYRIEEYCPLQYSW
eukprot:CAMPEP_0113312208 /NCGR_PEP_ID=MMETSP0010_2-20120614/9127_1 /TAXON_ID=216773 ORGANISM="Corethron hystrix, Strain 308" /NCGR_SAMPLE_ID=MMETSP0010_2 /ASSEMBLY_ACC=CAM_ASM_000155 /LENGTH=499 /DNA_ID=CAMNT_0000167981 /DNA_START=282 /DNA_END=1781 /DNA_ORIENTATION=- /assembly_acc=CAM_ASM_000155